MLDRIKLLVLRLWLRFSKVEHELLRKEHVLAAKAKVAVHNFEYPPLTEAELSKVEII